MAPSTQGAGPETAPPDADTTRLIECALAPLRDSAPTADLSELKRRLGEEFEHRYAQLRQQRGEVRLPDDVIKTVRLIHDVKLQAGLLADACKALVTRADDALGDELVEAVGEQDGVPAGRLKVEYNGAEISISPAFTTPRAIDTQQVLACLAELVALDWTDSGSSPAADPVGFAVAVAMRAMSDVLAKTELSIRGVQALAAALGHRGEDKLASAVRSAVRKRPRKYTHVKVSYKPDAA